MYEKIRYPYESRDIIKKLLLIIWYGHIKKYSLVSHVIAKPKILGGEEKHRREEFFTNMDRAKIIADGHKPCVGLHDHIAWAFIPQYMKLSNFEKFNVHVRDKNGSFIFSQDTSGTLHDAMVSENDHKFIKGFGKVEMSKMDLQTMIMILVVGAGAVFGLHFMGVF